MKSILAGLGVVVGLLWCIVALGTLLTLASGNMQFEWFTWILIAPALAFGGGIIILILWVIGEKARGRD